MWTEAHHSWKPFADFWLTSQSNTSLPWMTMMPLQISFQSHARKFACTSFHIGGFLFVRYGRKASCDFVAAYYWFCWLLISFPLHHLFCIALSSPWLEKRGWSICCCLSVNLYTLGVPIWLYAEGNMWFMSFTLHHHHCSFITDKDLTHIWYTNLRIYKNEEAGKFQNPMYVSVLETCSETNSTSFHVTPATIKPWRGQQPLNQTDIACPGLQQIWRKTDQNWIR